MNFCRRCGTPLTKKSETSYICENAHRLYANPAPSVNVFFLTDDEHVLLSVRGVEPYKGTIDTIGGFIDPHETTEQALIREIYEETGLTKDQYDSLAFLCSTSAPYPYDGEERDTLPLFFWAHIHPDVSLTAADDISAIVKLPLFGTAKSDLENMKVSRPFLQLRELIASKKSL